MEDVFPKTSLKLIQLKPHSNQYKKATIEVNNMQNNVKTYPYKLPADV